MTKKASLFLALAIVLLTGCALRGSSQPFVYNDQCLHVCWMGINPGVTNVQEARKILRALPEIDQGSYMEDEHGFQVAWYWKHKHPTYVGVLVNNQVVQELSLIFPTNVFKLQDITTQLGEPDEISVKRRVLADAILTEYIVYYLPEKIMIYIDNAGDNSPDPADSIQIMDLNILPDDPDAPLWARDHKGLRQPWLGYGHIEDYLKNRPSAMD